MKPPRQHYKNLILAALPPGELNRIAPHLSPVTFELRAKLLDGKSSYGYFVEEGLASVVLTSDRGETVEVGVVGKEGVVGIPILLGAAADCKLPMRVPRAIKLPNLRLRFKGRPGYTRLLVD